MQFFPLGHWFTGLIYRNILDANAAGGWNYHQLDPEPIQVATYDIGQHYHWHMDTFGDQTTTRKLSYILQLEAPETYDGGELEFLQVGTATPQILSLPDGAKQKGSVIIFPSFLLHRITPVTRGVRRSIACWMRGPHFV